MTERVIMGRINGLYGIQGWVKVFSYTSPMTNILNYSPWQIKQKAQWQTINVCDGRLQGKGVIAQLEGCHDRTTAMQFLGAEVAVQRNQLPPPAEGEYYWADLIGLTVITVEGLVLGQVDHLLATGSNDVLIVQGERERLIPLLFDTVVTKIDLTQKTLWVNWESDF
jgi:16S rRNA processing protein RimM